MITMPEIEETDTAHLPPHAADVLAVVEGFGREWTLRSAIARRMGKSRLTPYDIAMLDVLTTQGLVEARQTPTDAPSGVRWEYRAKG